MDLTGLDEWKTTAFGGNRALHHLLAPPTPGSARQLRNPVVVRATIID